MFAKNFDGINFSFIPSTITAIELKTVTCKGTAKSFTIDMGHYGVAYRIICMNAMNNKFPTTKFTHTYISLLSRSVLYVPVV